MYRTYQTGPGRPHFLQIAVAVFGATLAAFVVHGIGWNLLPLANASIGTLSRPDTLRSLQAEAPLPGTYFINSNAARDGLAVSDAPFGWTTLQPADTYSATRSLGLSLLVHLGCAAAVASILIVAGHKRFASRLATALLVSAFGLLAGPVWDLIWGWHSPAYAAAMTLHAGVSYGVMSLILAASVPTKET